MSNELRQIDRRLRNIEEMLEANELMNIEDAARFMGVAKKTMQNNLKGKLLGCYVINKLGHPMFFKSKLVNI